MKKFLQLAILLVLTAIPAFSQTPVSGQVVSVNTGTTINSSSTFVRFTLKNFGNQTPFVTSTADIAQVQTDFAINLTGGFTGSIYGNDIITPTGTYYHVETYFNGAVAHFCDYFITTPGPFNLNTATCLNRATPIGVNQVITQSFVCPQLTPSLTWVCTHSFNDTRVEVETFNLGGALIWPDTINVTDSNTVTITFVVPQSGVAVIIHAGAVSIATNQPNAVLQNPTGAQVIDNGQTLTISGPLFVTSAAAFSGGGSLNGTWAGAPILTGLWAFNGGLTSAGPTTLNGSGSTSGAWTHSGVHTFNAAPVFTASPGFVISSNTVIPNLNASLLLGNTWAAPGPIGGTTPSTGIFTTVTATSSVSINGGTSLTTSNQSGTGSLCMTINCALTSPTITTPVINGASTGTGVQGTDSKLMTAGTISGGAGTPLCTTALGGATTSSCSNGGINQWFSFTGCTTAQSTDSSCTGTVTLPVAYADATYIPVMTPNSINGAFISLSVSGSLSTTGFPYTLTCSFNCSTIVAPTIYVFTHHN